MSDDKEAWDGSFFSHDIRMKVKGKKEGRKDRVMPPTLYILRLCRRSVSLRNRERRACLRVLVITYHVARTAPLGQGQEVGSAIHLTMFDDCQYIVSLCALERI